MTVGGASTSMPIVAPGCLLVEPPSVPAGLARSPSLIFGLLGGGEPDRVENVMREDDSDDEPDHILGDSDEDTSRNPPARQGPSSSGSHQHPPHFSTLNLEAVAQQPDIDPTFEESDHLKYHGICKEFENGCTWMVRITLRQRKGNWEVRRYNGTHTYLATLILSDHRQLNHHVICARIFPLVRADVAVTIKVLQEATEATYGFKPSYRKVWMEKQKAVA
ncbi:uncharacterized protein LOC107496820 [Arachis duranensis]|uniref:Uncharacterized protein LOC107496820 n=1 Tax=Arachis duranensis TaxID=130453 RepID=A0A6P4DX60_ARADU|nr:uncharacterized protein LOC107496820 [Arachis duranensis]